MKQYLKKNSTVLSFCRTLAYLFFILSFSACDPESEIPLKHSTWKTYGGGSDQSKFVVQDQITKDNVNQLEVAWTYPTGDKRSYEINPIIVDSIMYVFAKNSSIVAINATNGKELWIHAKITGIERRGLAYWESEDRSKRRLFFAVNNSLQALDAITGKSILDFGKNGVLDLRVGLGRDPMTVLRASSHTPGQIYGDLIILGTSPGESYMAPPGYIRAYNVITGEHAWTFHTVPQPGEYGYNTWPKDAHKYVGGANCWGEMTVDEDAGIVYVPLGSPTYDYYGADRIGSNLFANCLVALDATTGERIWHYQTVHHDLWDYDLASAPQLITINKEGKEIDAVAVATKTGFMFVFDRYTGEPVWPIEEKEVPPSTMPGEVAWPTQPFPVKIPAINRQTLTADDLSDIFLSDEEFVEWKERVSTARKGLFTPPDTLETIAIPGAVGGVNWGNSASYPEKGLVFVITQDYPSFYQLREVSPPSGRFQQRNESVQAIQKGKIAFYENCQACHGKDLSGNALGPSLLTVAEHLNVEVLNSNILYGTGRMPSIANVDPSEIPDILAFIKSESSSQQQDAELQIEGPVVASGGLPQLETS